MSVLPQGTVTFLFTDIEGSTRLLHELGDDYAAALEEHRRALRTAFERHGGVEVDTQGDAFFVAFAKASDALAAAGEARDSLAGGPIRVRMGLHTGEPKASEEGYVGIDVHRAARIAAAGHGGQILVSQSTRDLAAGDDLRDLGEHRLKDLAAPERIYQLGDEAFPPLKSLNNSNLPQPADPLLGRKKELADVLRLLHGDARVVTVTGPGGIGKTRFALEVAGELTDRFADGVWWVGLASLSDPALVLAAMAAAIGANRELSSELNGKSTLFLLDNFEQVVDAASDLAGLQRSAPHVVLLVTSREPLHIAGEHVYSLRPLAESPAVELFRQRAEAVSPGFDAEYGVLSAICDRVDRLPLALELAAARTTLLSASDLLARLGERLPLLTSRRRDVDERQRTLRATIEWSYELLDDADKELFAGLAVFAGGFDAEAAEVVCGAGFDALESLVDKSLLRHADSGRFFMFETIREHALERLAGSGKAGDVRRRHAEHYARVAESTHLASDLEGEQRHDLALLEADNFRAALTWAHEGGESELGLRIAVSLENFWATQDPRGGIRWFELFLASDAVPTSLRARALRSMGSSATISGEYDRGRDLYAESLALSRAAGDEHSVAQMLMRMSIEANRAGDTDEALRLARESLDLSTKVGNRRAEAQALTALAGHAWRDGQRDSAFELAARARELCVETGFVWWQCIATSLLAEWSLETGRVEHAERYAVEALELARRMNDRLHMVEGLAVLAWVAVRQARLTRAGRLWGAVEAEEARGGLGIWDDARDAYADEMPRDDAEFCVGESEGQVMTLDAAVQWALGSID